jgi:hypothetical protein
VAAPCRSADIELKPGSAPLGKIEAKSRSGNIHLELPESAKFDLKATSSRAKRATTSDLRFKAKRQQREHR